MGGPFCRFEIGGVQILDGVKWFVVQCLFFAQREKRIEDFIEVEKQKIKAMVAMNYMKRSFLQAGMPSKWRISCLKSES